MNRIGQSLLALAALYIVVGISLGIGMGIAHNFLYAPVHAHINLVGWVTHGLMGLAFLAWPQLAENRLAKPQVLVFTCSAPVFLAGLVIAVGYDQPLLAIIGSLGVWVGVVLFAYIAVRTAWFGAASQTLSAAPAE